MCTGEYGCEWVCMGALGHRGTGVHKNKTSISKNGLVGLGFRCMYGREISRKIHTCAVRHTGGNEGLRRVGMSSDGCRGMHWHVANAKQGKKSD